MNGWTPRHAFGHAWSAGGLRERRRPRWLFTTFVDYPVNKCRAFGQVVDQADDLSAPYQSILDLARLQRRQAARAGHQRAHALMIAI